MAITFVGSTVNDNEDLATDTEFVLDVPSGVQANDVLVAVIGLRNTGHTLSCTGWTLQATGEHTHTSDLTTMAVLTRTATGSEPASYTFATDDAATTWSGVMLAARGVDTTSLFNDGPEFRLDADFNTSHWAPDLDPTVSGTMVIAAWCFRTDSVVGNFTGPTDTGFVLLHGSHVYESTPCYVGYQIRDESSPTLGDLIANSTASDRSLNMGLLLTPTSVTDATPTPVSVDAPASVPDPTVGGGTTVPVAAVDAVTTVPAVVVDAESGDAAVDFSGVASVAQVPGPTIATNDANVTPATATTATTIFVPTVFIPAVNVTATPSTVPVVPAMPTPTVVNTNPPVITSGPTVGSITQTTATISWITNEPSDSTVEYQIGTVVTGSNGTEVQIRAGVPFPTVDVGSVQNQTINVVPVAAVAAVPGRQPTASPAPDVVAAVAGVPEVDVAALSNPVLEDDQIVAAVASVPTPNVTNDAIVTTVNIGASVLSPIIVVGLGTVVEVATVEVVANDITDTTVIANLLFVEPNAAAIRATVPTPLIRTNFLLAVETVTATYGDVPKVVNVGIPDVDWNIELTDPTYFIGTPHVTTIRR